jgi:hypothetical protein
VHQLGLLQRLCALVWPLGSANPDLRRHTRLAPGTQFTSLTSTKVQIVQKYKYRHLTAPQKEQKEAGQELEKKPKENKAHNKPVDQRLAVNEPCALLNGESNARCGMAGGVEEVGGAGGLGRAGSDLLRQCFLYDPDGTYIRTWVSEVDKMAAPWCFAPWEQNRVDKLDHRVDELDHAEDRCAMYIAATNRLL